MYRFLVLACLMLVMAPADAGRISAGPMPGHATSRTASLWMQADGPGALRLEYWPQEQPDARRLSPVTPLQAEADFTAHVELVDLLPGTRYGYSVWLDDTRQLPDSALVFDTLPQEKRLPATADFTAYLGSCAFINDPAADRPGKAYGGGYEIFQSIASAADASSHPHFMLWLGDAVYFREADYASPWGMNARYRQARALPELQPLLRATRHYAIWDDHDYGPNNSNRGFVFKDASLELFQRYWANPGYGLKELPGVFTAFSYLDADFFLLDDRFFRAADSTAEPSDDFDPIKEAKEILFGYNTATRILTKPFRDKEIAWAGENKSLFGPRQLDWLKQSLIQSTATFKIIASGSQLFNDANRHEGWQNFEREREGFLAWLAQQDIPGVVFLSGDRHHTELTRRERKGTYPIYELTCSPLTSSPRAPGQEEDNRQRVAGTLVSQRNYCSLDFSGPPKARLLTLRSHDSQGKPLWSHALTAAELRKPAREDAGP
jgi:alkaline phosphatase D